ncbi:hypothetical protein EJ08DRAFT_656648 [Tothia fuscella]|uniref:Killer toxin Kp4 domain-containing protein n=1 Tax=Tothia fuscella TaxID=1048955 RepID=A0A9P4NYW7_9PEZI|nr:hypothetical protein EJ08DRAFT_656648 [Tothia fuscella]
MRLTPAILAFYTAIKYAFGESSNSSQVLPRQDYNVGYDLQGINCKGSGKCFRIEESLKRILLYLQRLGDDTIVMDTKPIACHSDFNHIYPVHICVWLHSHNDKTEKFIYTTGYSGRQVKKMAKELKDYGCQTFGSVPFSGAQGVDGIENGELTDNMVGNPGYCAKIPDMNGLCEIMNAALIEEI